VNDWRGCHPAFIASVDRLRTRVFLTWALAIPEVDAVDRAGEQFLTEPLTLSAPPRG
jgi:hypothetical protein